MEPLIAPQPVRKRQDRLKISLALLTMALILGGTLWAVMILRRQQGQGLLLPATTTRLEAEKPLPPVSLALNIPRGYKGLATKAQERPSPPTHTNEPAPSAAPIQPISAQTGNPFATPAPNQPGNATPVVPRPRALPAPPGQGRVARGTSGTPPTQEQPPNPPSKWLFAEVKNTVALPPFKEEEETETGRPGTQKDSARASQLFPQASWATPEDPTRVLYRSQVINGLLQHAVNSDHPGTIRVLVSEEVTDRFGQGQVLLPQYAILLGAQEGKPSYGQSRLPIVIDSVEFPNGVVLSFNKAKLGDSTGATGIEGQVNNHYGKLGLAAVLTAALSVGSRAVAGSPQGYQPNLAQDFAADASKSVNQTGQRIIDRELNVPPTITLKPGEPVTVQLSENVSLQTPPITVRK